jgi:hypothetical protein
MYGLVLSNPGAVFPPRTAEKHTVESIKMMEKAYALERLLHEDDPTYMPLNFTSNYQSLACSVLQMGDATLYDWALDLLEKALEYAIKCDEFDPVGKAARSAVPCPGRDGKLYQAHVF